jgi:NTE family protein
VTDDKEIIGLAMTGGGARGAYQAGVLKRIGQIKSFQNKPGPFKVIGGASAGAVNGTAVATGNHDFSRCTEWVAQLWADLRNQDVYRSDVFSLVPKAGRWIKDFSLGAVIGGGRAHSLLDSTPLGGFLARYLRCDKIQENINKGNLKALCISATNYKSGKNYFFIHGDPAYKMWNKTRRVAIATPITIAHVCASAAIPVIFKPVQITTSEGTDYYGDGCLRLHAPLSPVIRLGATRILAIGLRSESNGKSPPSGISTSNTKKVIPQPTLAQVIGVSLNAIFLDHLDADVEHLVRLNQIITSSGLAENTLDGISEPIKIVEPLTISPSYDLAKVAEGFSHKLPTAVRYFMSGLGTKEASSSDLISYLNFDSEYTKALINMGYADADDRIGEIEDFLCRE